MSATQILPDLRRAIAEADAAQKRDADSNRSLDEIFFDPQDNLRSIHE